MFMGIDQYGYHYDGLVHPRKDLMTRIGSKHVNKMYVDKINGKTVHCGYVIGRLWITIYEVKPWAGIR